MNDLEDLKKRFKDVSELNLEMTIRRIYIVKSFTFNIDKLIFKKL